MCPQPVPRQHQLSTSELQRRRSGRFASGAVRLGIPAIWKQLLALTAVVVVVFAGAAAAPTSAKAYYTSTNWYSKTWYFNKHETWEIGWGGDVSGEFVDIMRGAEPGALTAALAVYGYSFIWIAQQARSHNECIAVTWIYVNLPYPWQYRGSACYDS